MEKGCVMPEESREKIRKTKQQRIQRERIAVLIVRKLLLGKVKSARLLANKNLELFFTEK